MRRKASKIQKATFVDALGTPLAVFSSRWEGKAWAMITELEAINKQVRRRLENLEKKQAAQMRLIHSLSDALNQALRSLRTGEGTEAAVQAIQNVLGEA